MTYHLTLLDNMVILEPHTWVNDGTPEWDVYQAWVADGNSPTPLPAPRRTDVPRQIPLWQARATLRAHSLFQTVDDYVEAYKTIDPVLWEAWNFGNYVDRDGLFVNSLCANFNITEEQLDDLFVEASQLVA